MITVYVKDLFTGEVTSYNSILAASKDIKVDYGLLRYRVNTEKAYSLNYRFLISGNSKLPVVEDLLLEKYTRIHKRIVILVKKNTRSIRCFESHTSLSKLVKHNKFSLRLTDYDVYTYDTFKKCYPEIDWKFVARTLISNNVNLQKNVLVQYRNTETEEVTNTPKKYNLLTRLYKYIKIIF